jgi:hypothetical protein
MTQNTDHTLESKILEMAEQMVTQMEKDLLPSQNHSARRNGRQVTASLQVTNRVHSSELQALNSRELQSIYSLLGYIAHNENVYQDQVENIVGDKFAVDQVAALKKKDYEEVIRFLVDLRIDELGD